MTWGIVPAAGLGSRIQPLAFSKELLPVGEKLEGASERPKAVSEYLLERMVFGGASRICFVISRGKSDILEYYGSRFQGAALCYAVQQDPVGLCDAVFQALPFITDDEPVLIGLPDTVWFPERALSLLADDAFSFLCFPVNEPEHFDAVISDETGAVQRIQVKQKQASSNWIWGAIKLPAWTLRELYELWRSRDSRDVFLGSLINAYLEQGGKAVAVPAGTGYVDVGTLNGYRDAIRLLDGRHSRLGAPSVEEGARA